MNYPKIILASTSSYRKSQLETLGFEFSCVRPKIHEETEKKKILNSTDDPVVLAKELSFLKGKSVAQDNQWTISGDQLLSIDKIILGKPGNYQNACHQLALLSGKSHRLITAITFFNGLDDHSILNITQVTLKQLTPKQIHNYLIQDEPFDCAGSYKIESKGIQIIDKIVTDDFTAIQGIPLIELSHLLNKFGLEIPAQF